jgi:hypothetical protein
LVGFAADIEATLESARRAGRRSCRSLDAGPSLTAP